MDRTLRALRSFALPTLLIALLMTWLGGMFHPRKVQAAKLNEPRVSAAGVPARAVLAITVPEIVEAVGAVQAQRKTTVAARVTASVVSVSASSGQRVRRGDVLVRLDDRDLQAKARQAHAAVARAEATRDLAQNDYARDKQLFDQATVPGSALDVTVMRVRTSTADVAVLQDVLHDADVSLDHSVLRSPYDGVVIDRTCEPGDIATPGKALLTLYEDDRLWLEAAVPEEDVTALRLGDRYQVHVDALRRDLEGSLVEIVPASDAASRTVTARLAIPAAPSLYPGLFGRLLLPVGQRQRLSIPSAALLRVGQLTMVDVVLDGALHRRSVQIGRSADGEIEILSGLAAGDSVSLAPRKELAP